MSVNQVLSQNSKYVLNKAIVEANLSTPIRLDKYPTDIAERNEYNKIEDLLSNNPDSSEEYFIINHNGKLQHINATKELQEASIRIATAAFNNKSTKYPDKWLYETACIGEPRKEEHPKLGVMTLYKIRVNWRVCTVAHERIRQDGTVDTINVGDQILRLNFGAGADFEADILDLFGL